MDEGMSGFCMKANGGRSHGGTKCGRWNPTEEQVKVLTDLFRSGLRTPTTDQIQKISSQLSYYGKIESKNVFYWFQNHKARERQKRRKVSVEECLADIGEKSLPSKRFTEMEQVREPEKVIETLQLFPLNSYYESESEKWAFFQKECEGNQMARDIDYPPLDLRLSFF